MAKKLILGAILANLAQIQIKTVFVSHQISWSAIIMYNIRKN